MHQCVRQTGAGGPGGAVRCVGAPTDRRNHAIYVFPKNTKRCHEHSQINSELISKMSESLYKSFPNGAG